METRVKEGRTALAITILLIATLTVPTLVVGGAFGLANAQQSPSPTGTAPTIELVNPSDYEAKPVISDKDHDPGNDSSGDNPDDEKYHFNAWTRNAPNDASVEYFIVQGSNQVSLGLATHRGGGVYELFSGIPDSLNDADATVRAVLYGGTSELDRDEQLVTINQKTADETDETVTMQREFRASRTAETVEITYPENIGGVGFFGRTGQPKAASIEVKHSRTGTAGSAADQGGGPENIRVYYTTSHRGTDPDWKECGTDESQSDASDGVRCELIGQDTPEIVTGIAAVAMDQEAAPNTPRNVDTDLTPNSGDAHVASGYTQNPSSVTITSPPGSTPPGCSPMIPVLVADQIGRKIVGAPVDVHAQGPADSLSFVTERDETGGSNEPHDNQPPQNHSTEQGRKCDGSVSDELQGEHEEAGAAPDRKHIESVNGTDGSGRFLYKMFSNTAGGTTMTAFVDMDDNDRFCATEAKGDGIINWGNGGPAAPQPAPPEEQTCNASASTSPSGSASSSASASASASASSSASASPSGSPSTSPSRSASTSPSTSPSGSASTSPSTSPSGSTSPSMTATGTGTPTGTGTTATSPQQAAVEVTLEASQPRKTFGKSFTLSGSVTSDNPACTDLVTVQIHRDVVGGQDEFELFAQETTDENGAFSVTDRADVSANYIARAIETTACDDATSAPQPVLVRTKVSLTLSRDKVAEGGRVRFTIKTAPCPLTARDKVLLFRAIEGEFGKSGRTTTNARCVGTIVRRVSKSSVFQARWSKQTPELLAGRSRSKAVRVTD